MNRTTIRLLLLLVSLTALPHLTRAQDNLAIKGTFDLYSKRSGVTAVELRGEMVSAYDMTLYKSITVEENELALKSARLNIEVDKSKAVIIREVIKGGNITSGFYRLRDKTKDGMNRYIIFKLMNVNTFAIVYVEGKLSTEALMKFLKIDTSF